VKLERTINYNFGWLVLVALVNVISISGGAVPAIYFRDQRVTVEQLGPLLDAAKREGQSIIIKADRSTSYETVAEVTNAALEHGITSVALAAASPR